uniref:NADH dehydrogenase [ubiquinone] 1 beta subcomplex subunit 10 n=1 Tax=Zonotrichia albicollis TaxID=44394 RepID=A0A8D2M8M0_ZONAL
MPEDRDWEAYKVPPTRTPVSERTTSVPNPVDYFQSAFNYVLDSPVGLIRGWIERWQNRNKFYYYHQKFRRVPDLSQCLEGDYLCYYEAEAQWRRDRMVDQEIVEIVRERMAACKQREGPNQFQNCAKEMELLAQVTKAYQDRYGELGFHGNARTCLMKQKHRMMEERKAAVPPQWCWYPSACCFLGLHNKQICTAGLCILSLKSSASPQLQALGAATVGICPLLQNTVCAALPWL